MEVPREAGPESQAGVPAKAETVESKPVVREATRLIPQPPLLPPPLPPPQAGGDQAIGGETTLVKDELTQEIEEVLSEDLEDLYKQLPPERQQKFKQEGERAAGIIRQMIWHGKFHGRRILSLIVRWLKLIPGVNKFFLEQESKIKTDKLQQLAEDQKKNSTRL